LKIHSVRSLPPLDSLVVVLGESVRFGVLLSLALGAALAGGWGLADRNLLLLRLSSDVSIIACTSLFGRLAGTLVVEVDMVVRAAVFRVGDNLAVPASVAWLLLCVERSSDVVLLLGIASTLVGDVLDLSGHSALLPHLLLDRALLVLDFLPAILAVEAHLVELASGIVAQADLGVVRKGFVLGWVLMRGLFCRGGIGFLLGSFSSTTLLLGRALAPRCGLGGLVFIGCSLQEFLNIFKQTSIEVEL